MPYLAIHHGTYWFQIRVPRKLVGRYGQLIRQNLQTNERAFAQQLAYQLASAWLSRFSIEKVNDAGLAALPLSNESSEVISVKKH